MAFASSKSAAEPSFNPGVLRVVTLKDTWCNSPMSIEFEATYRSGAIVPNRPLALPENTPVHVVVEKDAAAPGNKPRRVSLKGLARDEIIALRPNT
jgi:hypothetical protein